MTSDHSSHQIKFDGVNNNDSSLWPIQPNPRFAQHWVLIVVIVLTALPELVLLLADYQLIGSTRWRPLAYQYGAFWAGLLHGWTPNYPAQPFAMFVTYGFLHAGIAHLFGNIVGLVWLGQNTIDRAGERGFLIVYVASMLGGAVAFGLLATNPSPMIGASGALFGLAGFLVIKYWRDRRVTVKSGWEASRPVVLIAALLIGVNALQWWWQDGNLAWQAHFGGFITGAALGAVFAPRKNAVGMIVANDLLKK